MNLNLDSTSFRGDFSERFYAGHPFPLLTIDNFLPKDFSNELFSEIQKDSNFQKSSDYIFAKNKFESPKIENLGPCGSALKEYMGSSEFAQQLSLMYGKPIFVDPDFVGGGLHRGGAGSFLDMHTDFNLHPINNFWIRELNILLYLNKDWKPEYGGSLDLRNSKNNLTASVEPIFNRLVLMKTNNFTFHGYKPISFPEGTFRTSIATYAYTLAHDNYEIENLKTTTTWIPENASFFKKIVAKLTPSLVLCKQRLFGSSTAKRRK